MVVKRFGVLSVGKILGTVYALLGLVIGAFTALFSLLGAAIGAADPDASGAILGGVFVGVGSIILFPLFYGVLGFTGGNNNGGALQRDRGFYRRHQDRGRVVGLAPSAYHPHVDR